MSTSPAQSPCLKHFKSLLEDSIHVNHHYLLKHQAFISRNLHLINCKYFHTLVGFWMGHGKCLWTGRIIEGSQEMTSNSRLGFQGVVSSADEKGRVLGGHCQWPHLLNFVSSGTYLVHSKGPSSSTKPFHGVLAFVPIDLHLISQFLWLTLYLWPWRHMMLMIKWNYHHKSFIS